MKIPLTDIGVRALKAPRTGQTTVWDTNSPVGVRVSQGGSKTYVVLIGSGRRRTIGRVGILKLAEAREEAKRILAEKTLGLIKAPSTVTFESALPGFLEENYRDRRPRSKRESKRLLEKHFLPVFRRKAVADITDRDIWQVLNRLSNRPSEQLHAFRMLRTFLRWCVRPPRRYLTHSPLEGYAPPGQDKKGTRVLSDEELVRVWQAASGAFGGLVRLLILWGTRNGETGRVRRDWVEDGMLTIPGSVTKNHRAHGIPLLPIAREILDRQPSPGRFYFPGLDGEPHFPDWRWRYLKRQIDKRAGIEDWDLRDIRRTFRSNMAKLRVPREVAEILLNHVTGANKSELDEIYDRYDYLDEKREALQKWEDKLTALLART